MIVRQGFTQEKTHPSNERLFLGFNDRLAVGVLPVSAFASGHTYHVQHLHKVRSVCLVYLWQAPAARCDIICKPCLVLQQWESAVAHILHVGSMDDQLLAAKDPAQQFNRVKERIKKTYCRGANYCSSWTQLLGIGGVFVGYLGTVTIIGVLQ